MNSAQKLRGRLEAGEKLLMMGVWDVLSAKVTEKAGFDGAALQSFQYSAGWGVPDVGLRTASDLLDVAFKMAGEIEIPIVLDFEQGFGSSPAHAAYWVREFERAGVAAVHIDDKGPVQICPWLPGAGDQIRYDSAEETAAKIRAMDAARNDLMIIARCQVGSVGGVDPEEEMRRLVLYREAGADIIYAPKHVLLQNDLDALHKVSKELGKPIFMQMNPPGYIKNYVPKGTSDGKSIADRSFAEVFEAGASIINSPQLYPIAYRALSEALSAVKETGSLAPAGERMFPFDAVLDLLDYERFEEK